MSYIDKPELIPKDTTGLADYKFVTPYTGVIYVYHYTGFSAPHGRNKENWLCCTEGWRLKNDNKWHETISCGYKPDRIVDSIDDIFNCYRENK